MNWKAFQHDPRFSCLVFLDHSAEQDGDTGAMVVMKFYLPGEELGSIDVEIFYADTESRWGHERAAQFLRLLDQSRVTHEFENTVEPLTKEYDD